MSDLVKKSKREIKKFLVYGIIGASIFASGNSYFSSDSIVTKINDVQVKRYNNKDTYLVFTDEGVFKNTDAWYRLKFRSSDVQGVIMKNKGEYVKITKYGWRFPLLSWYENILEVDEIEMPQSSTK